MFSAKEMIADLKEYGNEIDKITFQSKSYNTLHTIHYYGKLYISDREENYIVIKNVDKGDIEGILLAIHKKQYFTI